MQRRGVIAALFGLAMLWGCATTYKPDNWTGGFRQEQLEPDMWRVTFLANGYTTSETAQTYWLYRCTELTLGEGYSGFEIITPINLTAATRDLGAAHGGIVRIHGGGGGGSRTTIVTVYGGAGYQAPKPIYQAVIRLQKAPFAPAPPRSFDAAALRDVLAPRVSGRKCNGNVCPHVHDYLYAAPARAGVS